MATGYNFHQRPIKGVLDVCLVLPLVLLVRLVRLVLA